jgi:hypothetical protein
VLANGVCGVHDYCGAIPAGAAIYGWSDSEDPATPAAPTVSGRGYRGTPPTDPSGHDQRLPSPPYYTGWRGHWGNVGKWSHEVGASTYGQDTYQVELRMTPGVGGWPPFYEYWYHRRLWVFLGTTPVTPPLRTYDGFRIKVPVGTLDSSGSEYELVPTLPTPDTYGGAAGGAGDTADNRSGMTGPGVKIASLHCATAVGQDRPDVIFELGDGHTVEDQPAFGEKWFIGDTVRARAKVYGVPRFPTVADLPDREIQVRAYEAEIDIDDDGGETVKPKLAAT